MDTSKDKKPAPKRPKLKRDPKTGRIPGIFSMGDMIDDQERNKKKK